MEVTPEGEIMLVGFPAGTGMLTGSCSVRTILFAWVYGVTRSTGYQLKCEHDSASLVLSCMARVLTVFGVLAGSIQPEQELAQSVDRCGHSNDDENGL